MSKIRRFQKEPDDIWTVQDQDDWEEDQGRLKMAEEVFRQQCPDYDETIGEVSKLISRDSKLRRQLLSDYDIEVIPATGYEMAKQLKEQQKKQEAEKPEKKLTAKDLAGMSIDEQAEATKDMTQAEKKKLFYKD